MEYENILNLLGPGPNLGTKTTFGIPTHFSSIALSENFKRDLVPLKALINSIKTKILEYNSAVTSKNRRLELQYKSELNKLIDNFITTITTIDLSSLPMEIKIIKSFINDINNQIKDLDVSIKQNTIKLIKTKRDEISFRTSYINKNSLGTILGVIYGPRISQVNKDINNDINNPKSDYSTERLNDIQQLKIIQNSINDLNNTINGLAKDKNNLVRSQFNYIVEQLLLLNLDQSQPEQPVQPEQTIPVQPEQAITVQPEQAITVQPEQVITVQPEQVITDETQNVSVSAEVDNNYFPFSALETSPSTTTIVEDAYQEYDQNINIDSYQSYPKTYEALPKSDVVLDSYRPLNQVYSEQNSYDTTALIQQAQNQAPVQNQVQVKPLNLVNHDIFNLSYQEYPSSAYTTYTEEKKYFGMSKKTAIIVGIISLGIIGGLIYYKFYYKVGSNSSQESQSIQEIIPSAEQLTTSPDGLSSSLNESSMMSNNLLNTEFNTEEIIQPQNIFLF